MKIKKLSQLFDLVNKYWTPKIIGELNNQYVKIAKFQGIFDNHMHENEDELFFVIEGTLKIKIADKILILNPNELVIIPKGVNHQPIAENEVKVLLFEPKTTLNTGNVLSENTITKLDRLE